MERQIPVCSAAGTAGMEFGENRGGEVWEDMSVTNKWLKWDLEWVQSIGG